MARRSLRLPDSKRRAAPKKRRTYSTRRRSGPLPADFDKKLAELKGAKVTHNLVERELTISEIVRELGVSEKPVRQRIGLTKEEIRRRMTWARTLSVLPFGFFRNLEKLKKLKIPQAGQRRYLTPPEMAKKLGVSIPTVLKYAELSKTEVAKRVSRAQFLNRREKAEVVGKGATPQAIRLIKRFSRMQVFDKKGGLRRLFINEIVEMLRERGIDISSSTINVIQRKHGFERQKAGPEKVRYVSRKYSLFFTEDPPKRPNKLNKREELAVNAAILLHFERLGNLAAKERGRPFVSLDEAKEAALSNFLELSWGSREETVSPPFSMNEVGKLMAELEESDKVLGAEAVRKLLASALKKYQKTYGRV